MLSYQHHFHAGNHGDVIKHWLLIECLTYLQQKDKPFDYIDTHAGAGLYDLTSSKATKTQESHAGVLRLDWSSLPALTNYHDAIHDDLAQVKYPGSPLLVKRTLRQGDKAWLFEMHPQTIVELRQHCAEKRLSYVQEEDGFQGLLRLLPNKSRRALVLIDPSYEIKSDYQKVVDVMTKAYKKMPQVTLLLWYPVVDRKRINTMERAVKQSGMRNVQLFELGVEADDQPGMSSSGMIIVNPPWTLAQTFNAGAPSLAQQLSQDGALHFQFKQLVDE